MKTDYAGIDYGHGRTNLDAETGVRYGVIHLNRLVDPDMVESVHYCGCSSCGREFNPEHLTDRMTCPDCGRESWDYECWSDEPIGYRYAGEGIVIEGHADGDLFVLKSPVAIRAQYCSPCAPGAGHLDNPCDSGPLTYALPMDWFDAEYSPATYSESDLIRLAD